VILDLLTKRFSVRQFQEKPVSPEVLEEILQAGRRPRPAATSSPGALG